MRSFLLPLLLLCSLAMTAADPVKQTLRAKRVENDLKIDGILDEAAWHHEHAQTAHFIANQPVAGKVSDQATFVSVLYDDYAIYIGVKLFDKPENIKRELGLRDDFDRNSDWFSVMFDTYDKQQNAFAFGVTAAGVQGDALASADGMDGAWNAVWKSAVKMADDGWVVEMQIPYAALRFPKQDVQVWGINFGRYLRNTQEETYWNYINPNVNGTVTQFGKLEGISAVKPPLRLQLYPFLSGYANKEKGQPITPAFGYGADLKFGINEAYTVDMSLVPDFRQTISDQKVLNLGPYEVQFQENRQFFTEGTELFNRGGIFYSRRIGQSQYLHTQQMGATDTIVNYAPETAPIYNITKLSGRGKNGLGVGLLNAVTGPTYYSVNDTTDETGQTRKLMADPFINYNIFVVDKNMQHNSNYSFVTSTVNRGEYMGGENVSLGRVSLFDKTNTWNPGASFHVSNSWRPDSAGNMINTPGYRYGLTFNKVSGNFQFYLTRHVESNTYTHNALGYLQAPNEVSHFVSLAYYRNKPFMKGLFNNGKVFFNPYHTQLHTPRVYSEGGYSLNANAQFKNFWGISLEHWYGMGQDDYFEARTPGYFFSSPGSGSFSLGMNTDARKKLYVEADAGFWSRTSWNQWDNWSTAMVRMRISNQFSLSHEANWNYRRRERGFAGKLYDINDSLTNVIIGERYVNTITNTLSGQWTFNPYMGLNLRVRHYWSHVDVVNTYDLDTLGQIHAIDLTGQLPSNGVPTTHFDRNYNVFNVDLQYSWQFAPGSFMNVVWKNIIETSGLEAGETYGENLDYLLKQGGTNSLSVRMIFFLDYQTVMRKLG